MSTGNLDRNYFTEIMLLLKTSVLVQVLQLAGTFVLTLYFKKENFGSLSFILSLSTIFEMAAGLQYNTAAVVNGNKNNALKLMAFSSLLAAAVAAAVLLFIIVIFWGAVPLYNYFNSYTAIFALPFILVTNFIFNNGIQVLKYLGKIKAVNKFRCIYVVATLTAKFIAAFTFATVAGLVYAHLIGIGITCLIFLFQYKTNIKTVLAQTTYKTVQPLLKENYRFPKYAVLSSIVNAAANISFPILITLFFGLQQNGVYYLTTVFIFQPLQLILQAISDAFLYKIKDLFYTNRQLLLQFIKAQQKLILKLVIPYLLLAVLAGELLFKYLLPQQWTEVGEFIKYAAIFYIFASLYSPFSIVADYMKKQGFLLLFNLSLFLFQLGTLYLLHTILNFVWVILIASIISAIHYAFINVYMLGKLKHYS